MIIKSTNKSIHRTWRKRLAADLRRYLKHYYKDGHMRYLIVFVKVAIIVFSLYSFGYAENWVKFFSNAAGYDFFYNKDSMAYPSKDTVLIWYRNVPRAETENKVWSEWLELREVDCIRRRYKRLQGRVTYDKKPMEELNESSWIYLEPYDLDIVFYNTACVGIKQ